MMRTAILTVTCLLAACSSPAPMNETQAVPDAPTPAASETNTSSPPPATPTPGASPASETVVSTPSPAATTTAASCATQIGEAAARRLVQQCLQASPATHPPCNVNNSCTMIRDEITRSCDLFDADDPNRPGFCGNAASVGSQAAAMLVRQYYAAIGNRDYRYAYSMWRDDGKASGKTLAAFTAGFAQTRSTHVVTEKPSAPEGAAGSSYVTVPVTVTATTRSGQRQRFTGSYVLQRTNDVPGASIADRQWHIRSAALKQSR